MRGGGINSVKANVAKGVIFAVTLFVALAVSMVSTHAYATVMHECNDQNDCLVHEVATMINELPAASDITVDNAAKVIEQINAIDRIKANLTDEEYEELLTLVKQGDNGSGGGLNVPIHYMEAVAAIQALDGNSLAVSKGFFTLDNATVDTSNATVKIKLTNTKTSESQVLTLSTLDYQPGSLSSDSKFYSTNANGNGWSYTYILPSGTYVIEEVSDSGATVNGEAFVTTSTTYSVNGANAKTEPATVVLTGNEATTVVIGNYGPGENPAEKHSHFICGGTTCSSHGVADSKIAHSKTETYKPLTSVLTSDASGVYSGTLSTDGSYYLDQDITLASTLVIEANVNLCLNGNVLKLADSATGSVIQVADKDDKSAYIVNLADCNPATTHAFSSNNTLLWTLDSAGKETLAGGVITGGNNPSGNGGAINLGTYNTLNMYGGSLVGNIADSGAGVSLNSSGGANAAILNLYDGTIAHNNAETAAGIYLQNSSRLYMYGGSVNYNHAVYYGGAIGSAWSKQHVYMYNGEIVGNVANSGAAIHLYNTELYLAGGTVKENVSKSNNYATTYAQMSSTVRAIEILGEIDFKDTFFVQTWYENSNTSTSQPTGTYISVKSKPANTISVDHDAKAIENGTYFAKWEGNGPAPAANELFKNNTYKVVAKETDGVTAYYFDLFSIDTATSASVSSCTVSPADKSKGGETITVTPIVTNGETPVVSVTCKDHSVSAPQVTESNGVYTFTMPASDITISVDTDSGVTPDVPGGNAGDGGSVDSNEPGNAEGSNDGVTDTENKKEILPDTSDKNLGVIASLGLMVIGCAVVALRSKRYI